MNGPLDRPPGQYSTRRRRVSSGCSQWRRDAPGYDPADLLKLYIYGYLNRVRRAGVWSRRRTAISRWSGCYAGFSPASKDIADFRRVDRDAFRQVFRDFVRLCRQPDLYGRELVAVDGRRIKALNNPARNFTRTGLAEGHRDNKPVDAAYAALPSRRGDAQRKEPHAALPHGEVATALAAVDASAAWAGAKLALRFLVLTAARSAEVRGAHWQEIDLARAVWTVPAERMKAGIEHRVPLSTGALDILRDAAAAAGSGPLLFPTVRERRMYDNALSKLPRDERVAGVPHGFRSSFRDWAAERTDFRRAVVEAALAHRVADRVEAAYFRSDLFDRRCDLMQAWSDYLGPPAEGPGP